MSHRMSMIGYTALAATALLPGVARAQHDHHHPAPAPAPAPAARPAALSESEMDGAMSAMAAGVSAGPHIRLTPRRAATREDSARAAKVAAELRAAIEPYRDVRVAEEDGFKMFAPQIKQQRVYHFTSRRNAVAEHFRFDPARPTSLLYKRDAKGKMVLVGAMYVAPKRATLEELDARVPLGIAQWHAHTNICVPPVRERERWREMEQGQMRFGPAGAITTGAQCDSAGGRFHEQLFGWMVHANVFDKNVWEHEH